MNKLTAIILNDKLSIEVIYDFYEEEINDSIVVPNEVDNVTILGVINGDLEDLCQYIESKNGDFYEEIETKLLEYHD